MTHTREELSAMLKRLERSNPAFNGPTRDLLTEAANALLAPTPSDDVLEALRDLDKKLDDSGRAGALAARIGRAQVAVEEAEPPEVILGMLNGTMKYVVNTVVYADSGKPVHDTHQTLADRMDAAPVGSIVRTVTDPDLYWYVKRSDGRWYWQNSNDERVAYSTDSWNGRHDEIWELI
jgi:hypothetical protein